MNYREDIRKALNKSAKKKKEEEEEQPDTLAERIAGQLQLMIWPEREIEIKRQQKINEIKEEASG